jgi:hypothetical protein
MSTGSLWGRRVGPSGAAKAGALRDAVFAGPRAFRRLRVPVTASSDIYDSITLKSSLNFNAF